MRKNIKEDKSLRRCNKETGITLIALIITVIVMLILAGVTISLVMGDNGVISQATNASETTEEATLRQDLELALASCYAEYLASNKSTKIYDIGTEMKSYGYTVKGTVSFDSTSSLTITTSSGKEYTVKVTVSNEGEYSNITIIKNDSNSTESTLAEVVTAENYGDYVDYAKDLDGDGDTTNDWRIFYNDGENVFIIAADCISSSLIPSASGLSVDSSSLITVMWSCSVYTWQTASLSSVPTSFLINGFSSMNANNYNYKAACSLLDPERWKSFLDDEGYGQYATGGSTLEMFISSFKDSMGYEIGTTVSDNGYAIVDENWGTTGSLTLDFSSNSELTNLYNLGGASCFWLASPLSGLEDAGMLVVGCEQLWMFIIAEDMGYSWVVGEDEEADLFLNALNAVANYCLNNNYSSSELTCGCRPVVMLKNSVIGEQSADGVWTLSN